MEKRSFKFEEAPNCIVDSLSYFDFLTPCNCCPIYLSGRGAPEGGRRAKDKTDSKFKDNDVHERGKGRHGGARDEEERRNVQLARQIGRPRPDGQRSRRRRAQMLDSFTKRSPIKPPFHAPRR